VDDWCNYDVQAESSEWLFNSIMQVAGHIVAAHYRPHGLFLRRSVVIHKKLLHTNSTSVRVGDLDVTENR